MKYFDCEGSWKYWNLGTNIFIKLWVVSLRIANAYYKVQFTTKDIALN